MFLKFTASLGLHQGSFKGSLLHTKFFWNIVIQWTSHDDFFHFTVWWSKRKNLLNDRNSKMHFVILHQSSKSVSQVQGWMLFKKSVTSEFTLFDAVLFYFEWRQLFKVLICLLGKSLNHEYFNSRKPFTVKTTCQK